MHDAPAVGGECKSIVIAPRHHEQRPTFGRREHVLRVPTSAVAEGRRVTANIERSSNLFLTKTVYAALFALATVATGWSYPKIA